MAEQAKKPGFFSRIGRTLRDLRGEIKKVIWPTKKQLINNTVVVFIFVAICAIFISILDFLFSGALQLFFGQVG